MSGFATQAKALWARLTGKVYEADPLECPKCKAPLRVIAPIDSPPRRALRRANRVRSICLSLDV